MMSDTARAHVRMQLVWDEGLRLKPYKDTVGKLTIGIGRNLTDVGISTLEAYDLLDHDIDRAVYALVGRYPWFQHLDPVRQAVLVNLCFNMGAASLAKFVNTLAAVERGEYDAAARGLKASLWYRQVQKSRSSRLMQMLVSGEWPAEAV
jgi:lysozyme